MSKEDPTTFIEIKIRDSERVEDVSNIVTKYANEDGVDISGDTVQFSVDPGTPLAKAVSAHGIDKIEAALKRDVDKISDSVVVVMAPDEDYEQIDDNEEEGPSMANYPGGAPSSYAANEEGGGLTTPEDAEEYDGVDLDHFLTKEQPEDYIPSTDYEDVLDSLIKKDKEEHAKKKLNGGHIDDLRAEDPPDPFGGGYEDEEEFSYSPMLDSYKTSTADYLTEQAASDKRNKKTEVNNQSFKEKYKPKTHWQLGELRKYGL